MNSTENPTLNFLEPWQQTDTPSLYEAELKKELTFLHPLKWKRVRAIAIRTDRDDVLFEIQSGCYRYAVVHLTWQGKRERNWKFPVSRFYKDWQDLFNNRIQQDHLDWSED